ncbi:protease inhibitor I42 family protein [Hyphomonas sp.]|jgi:hypothetical protein|uniref:protease inhibitor I42 family protein n=1 Tax=Hyphomonas sp. TaxID=87 RepID=UPI0039E2AFF0
MKYVWVLAAMAVMPTPAVAQTRCFMDSLGNTSCREAQQDVVIEPTDSLATGPWSWSVAAPTPDDVTIRLTAADAGNTVAVSVGKRFAVELITVPSSGYDWADSDVPDFLVRSGNFSGPTLKNQLQTDSVEGEQWRVMTFIASEPGIGELVLVEGRAWESAVREYRVTITAR